MRLLPTSRLLLLTAILLAGCAASTARFTETSREKVGEQDLRSLVFHVASAVEFRSLRLLDTLIDDAQVKKAVQRLLRIDHETQGRILSQGDGWIAVDFGQGIVLRFQRRDRDGVYATAGWGTVTIAGERYDISVGILTGTDIELQIDR
jgi:hypothetical protein